MKKSFFLTLILICIVLVFSGCFNSGKDNSENDNSKNDNSVSVNNIEIGEQDVEDRLLYNKFTNSVNREYLKDVFGDAFEEEYQLVVLPENANEIKTSLIEDNVIIECCKENGIFIDRERATKTAKQEFDFLNSDETQEIYASFVHKTLLEYGLSEQEYVELLCEQAYYKYNRIVLKKYFSENLYEENDNKSLDDQFDDYIDALCDGYKS